MSKNLSHRQSYLNELDEAGIKVTFLPWTGVLEDRIRIKVQKGNSFAATSMLTKDYYNDEAYNRVLQELVIHVEDEWNKNRGA